LLPPELTPPLLTPPLLTLPLEPPVLDPPNSPLSNAPLPLCEPAKADASTSSPCAHAPSIAAVAAIVAMTLISVAPKHLQNSRSDTPRPRTVAESSRHPRSDA
jgi:hypothetical protein